MAIGGEGFSTNADLVSAAFAALAASLKDELQPFTNQISTEIEGEVQLLYGPKLAAFWTVDDSATVVDAGELAHIRTFTDDYRVTAYEYGIRPHEIWAHNIALRFDKDGETFYRRMVHHPGTRGHNLAPTLEEGITVFAEVGWEEGLNTILAAWADGL